MESELGAGKKTCVWMPAGVGGGGEGVRVKLAEP